jgi:hypothetical protein
VDQASKAAFIIAQAACATAEIAAMQAENQIRLSQGLSVAYDHANFMAVIDNYYIGHNAVIGYLRS